LDKTDTANLADGHRIFVALASRRRDFIQAAHLKTAGETPAPQKSSLLQRQKMILISVPLLGSQDMS